MSIEDMTTEQRALVQAAYNNGRRDGWKAGVDELVRILWSEQEVLVVGHNEDSVDEARVYAKPGHIIDDAGKVSKALESKAVPQGFIRDDKQVDRKVLGTLPLTNDGCVLGCGEYLWGVSAIDGAIIRIHTSGPHLDIVDEEGDTNGDEWDLPENTFSTRESALNSSTPENTKGEESEDEEREPPKSIGKCPKCGTNWYSDVGFCGGCRAG